jgi:mannosyl-3-phosphoglycerate phosphatase
MKIIFSDLDGTLLDARTYSYEAARPALEALKQRQTPLVLCTSKTRAEVELWRDRLGNQDPFIVENGGAIYIPQGYFPFALHKARERDGYSVIELGARYNELVETLQAASREAGCRVLGFHDMSVAEISLRSLLPVHQAVLAKQREYDEPFEILDSGSYRLLEAIERRGKHWTRGDRFYHIMGNNDKAEAVRRLGALYRKAFGDVVTVGVGDGWNDVKFLNAADIAIVVRSRFDAVVKKAVPHGLVTQFPGPHGWNEAVLQMIVA